MELTVISRETIKPSSQTPYHLQRLNLSLIDQYTPPIFIRILFFYSSHSVTHPFQTLARLKNSLPEVLTQFYPAAGTLDNQHSIHCNDSGLEYIQTRVKSPLTLSRLLACPKAKDLARLVPYEEYNDETGFQGLSSVQVNLFEKCGGLAIGVSISHRVADASSLALFVNHWAAVARGGDDLKLPNNKFPSPEFRCASLFPPRDCIKPEQEHENQGNVDAGRPQPKCVIRRFVFPQKKIDALKANYTYESPTRVEAVSALILKCLINASKSSKSSKPIDLCMGINLRARMNPPLPARYFGNLALPVMERVDPESSLNDLGVQIRSMIKELDSDYLEKLRADNALLFERTELQMKRFMNSDIRVLPTTSWCRFPWYEVDFGWGAPTWVAPVYLSSQDSFMLLDAKNGDGIEAWVTLGEDDMARLECDNELLEFARLNPMIGEST